MGDGQHRSAAFVSDAERQLEFTFQPRINPASRRMASNGRYPAESWSDRVDQLTMMRTMQKQKNEVMRQAEEAASLEECTFAPRTGRPPSATRTPSRKGPVHERLHNTRPAWEEERGTLLREREAVALSHCTFKPTLVTNTRQRASSAGRVPLHLRVTEVLRERNVSQSNARIRMELADEGVTFKPEINRRSVQLAERVQAQKGMQGVSAGERLYQAAMQRARPDDRGAADQECALGPPVNRQSRNMLARSQELPTGFLQRQEYLAQLAASKKDQYRRAEEEKLCTFQPAFRASCLDFGIMDLDSPQDWVTKLSVEDSKRRTALHQALTMEYYSQFPFAPDINPRSRAIGRPHSVVDLLDTSRAEQSRQRTADALDAREAGQCTFRPALNPRSLQVAESLPRHHDRGHQDVQARGAKLQDARQAREEEEMQACTFHPAINKQPPAKPRQDMQVPGMARYFELQQMATRKKQELEQRQQEVWWQNPRGSTRLFSVPKPFSFQQSIQEQQEQQSQAAG